MRKYTNERQSKGDCRKTNPVGLQIGGCCNCEETLNKGSSGGGRKVKMGTRDIWDAESTEIELL